MKCAGKFFQKFAFDNFYSIILIMEADKKNNKILKELRKMN